MTFSIRSILLVIAVVGIWLGAILSKSYLAIELAAAATNLFLLLSVALAVWHPQAEQRKFWTGFCLLGLGNFVLATYFSAYQSTTVSITNWVGGAPSVPTWSPYWTPSTISGPGTMYSGPPVSYTGAMPPTGNFPGSSLTPFQSDPRVVASAIPIFSLLAACAGGWLTLWMARGTKTEQ